MVIIEPVINSIKSVVTPLVWFGSTVIIMTLLYWGLVRFISLYCAPDGLYGIMMTAFTMGSPFCQAFTQILAKISEYYLILWSSIVTGFIAWFITTLNIKNPSNTC